MQLYHPDADFKTLSGHRFFFMSEEEKKMKNIRKKY